MQRKSSLEKWRALCKELAHDEGLAKAEQEQRRRVEKFGSLELEEAMLKGATKPKQKDREMER